LVSDDLGHRDYRMLAGFRFELRRFLRFSEDQAAASGLTAQQHQALLAIRAAPSRALRVGELAEWLLLRPHSASELVVRLERAGLVGRTEPGEDRREVRVALTDKGDRRLASLSTSHREELRRLRPLLTRLLAEM
jgi:DNA-binding MarR family transcriptional regulator